MKNLFNLISRRAHKFISRSCALYYRVGKGGSVPRISTLFIGLFFLFLAVNIPLNTLDTFTWYNGIFMAILVFLVWSGFSWFGAGFFSIWPVRFDDLDDFQKYTFSRISFHELTEKQAEEIVKIIEDNDNWF